MKEKKVKKTLKIISKITTMQIQILHQLKKTNLLRESLVIEMVWNLYKRISRNLKLNLRRMIKRMKKRKRKKRKSKKSLQNKLNLSKNKTLCLPLKTRTI